MPGVPDAARDNMGSSVGLSTPDLPGQCRRRNFVTLIAGMYRRGAANVALATYCMTRQHERPTADDRELKF